MNIQANPEIIIYLPLSSIIIPPNRQRKEINSFALSELISSIIEFGLLHPLIVSPLSNGTYELQTGERRYRAISTLSSDHSTYSFGGAAVPSQTAPCILLKDLTPFQQKSIELHENIIRENLSWQEQVLAIKELDELKRENGAVTDEAAAEVIASAKNISPSVARKQVSIAKTLEKHLDNPIVSKAKTATSAYRNLLRYQQDQLVAELTRRQVGIQKTPHTFLKGDARAILPTLPSASFNLIITDPPYGLSMDQGKIMRSPHLYDDSLQYSDEMYSFVLKEGFRLGKEQSAIFLFCTPERFAHIQQLGDRYGWEAWPVPLIWYKNNAGGVSLQQGIGFRRSYEMIAFFIKGSLPYQSLYNDLFVHTSLRLSSHPAQKPPDLYAVLMKSMAVIGDTVLDPFAGAGTIFAAASQVGLIATGIEISPEYIPLCESALVDPSKLNPQNITRDPTAPMTFGRVEDDDL